MVRTPESSTSKLDKQASTSTEDLRREETGGTENTQSSRGLDNVLRHVGRFKEQQPSMSSDKPSVSSEWAELLIAQDAFKNTKHRDRQKQQAARRELTEARKRFSQTPEGQTLYNMELAVKEAQKGLDQVDQQKELDAARAARETAEAAYHQTPEKMKVDKLVESPDQDNSLLDAEKAAMQTKEWEDLQSAWKRENVAEQVLHDTPEWKQLQQFKSLERNAKRAWRGLQEQTLLYTGKVREAHKETAGKKLEAIAAQEKRARENIRPSLSYKMFYIRTEKKQKEVTDTAKKLERSRKDAEDTYNSLSEISKRLRTTPA